MGGIYVFKDNPSPIPEMGLLWVLRTQAAGHGHTHNTVPEYRLNISTAMHPCLRHLQMIFFVAFIF